MKKLNKGKGITAQQQFIATIAMVMMIVAITIALAVHKSGGVSTEYTKLERKYDNFKIIGCERDDDGTLIVDIRNSNNGEQWRAVVIE